MAMKRGGKVKGKKKAVKKRGGGMMEMMGGGAIKPKKKMAMGMMGGGKAKKKMAGGGKAKKKMAGGGMAGKKKQAMKKGGVSTVTSIKGLGKNLRDKTRSMKAKIKMARTMKPTGRLNIDDIKRAGKLINKRAKGR